jgi:hypothetical protein
MMNPTTIPVTIAPEAAARVAELGMQRELERMLDFLRREVAGVLAVHVRLLLPYDAGYASGVELEVWLDRPWPNEPAPGQIRTWMAEALPPAFNDYFAVVTVPPRRPWEGSMLPGEAMNAARIPITISPAAADRVAQLSMQRELKQMLEHALRTVSGLRSVEVKLALPYDTDVETSITIEALLDHPNPVEDRTRWEWADWQSATFPPEVCWYIRLMTQYGTTHGR